MSGTSGRVDRVVVIHGPADPSTTAALTAVGFGVTACVGDTTVWAPVANEGAGPVIDPAPAGRLLTVDQAAAALGVGRTTTRKLIREGELEAVHVGRCTRIPIDAVDELVRRLRSRRPDRMRQSRRRAATRSAGWPSTGPEYALAQPSLDGGTVAVLGDTDASQRTAAGPIPVDIQLDDEDPDAQPRSDR